MSDRWQIWAVGLAVILAFAYLAWSLFGGKGGGKGGGCGKCSS